jgi:hypothetical protein
LNRLAKHWRTEEGFVLAGEAGAGQVFGGGRTAHGQRQRLAVFGAQAVVGLRNFRHQAGGQRRRLDGLARPLRPPRQVVDVLDVEAVECLAQDVPGA